MFTELYVSLCLISVKWKQHIVDVAVLVTVKNFPEIVDASMFGKITDKDPVGVRHSPLQTSLLTEQQTPDNIGLLWFTVKQVYRSKK